MIVISDKKLFPYPLPETCGIGTQDPLDFKTDPFLGKVYEPGWWQKREGEKDG